MVGSLERIEDGFDWVGKYCLGLGSVTGAFRMGVGVVAAVVSVVAGLVFPGMDACGFSIPEWNPIEGFVFGYKHVAIGASELIPGLKWILEDFFEVHLESNSRRVSATRL